MTTPRLGALLGPPRTRPEAVVGIAGGVLVAALLAAFIQQAGGWQHWSVLQIVVVAVTGLDLIGGIVTISAATAGRWYHRPGRAARRFRFGFVLAHAVLYLVPVSAVFGIGWTWAAANAALVLVAATATEFAPADLKRMVALSLTLAAALVNLTWLPISPALAWLPLLLLVKIVVCFQLPTSATDRSARRG